MTTRPKANIFKPKAFTAALEPKFVKLARQDPHWLQAIKGEFSTLMKNNT